MSQNHVIAEKIADGLAGGSIITVLGLTLSDADHVVSIIAGIVAIVAGLSAAYYHITKARRK